MLNFDITYSFVPLFRIFRRIVLKFDHSFVASSSQSERASESLLQAQTEPSVRHQLSRQDGERARGDVSQSQLLNKKFSQITQQSPSVLVSRVPYAARAS